MRCIFRPAREFTATFIALFTKCGIRVLNYQSLTTLSGGEVDYVGICPKHTRRSPNIAVALPARVKCSTTKGKECRIMTNWGENTVTLFSGKRKPTAGQTTPTMQRSTAGTIIKMFRKLSIDEIQFAISVRVQLNMEIEYFPVPVRA